MRSIARRYGLAAFAAVAVAASIGAPAGAQDLASKNFSSLLVNPNTNEIVFRVAGTPWVCPTGAPCVRLKFDKVADSALAGAAILPLGVADRNFYLSLQHTALNGGRAAVYNCTKDGCMKDPMELGEFTALGTFAVKQGDRMPNRVAILRRSDRDAGKSQIFWCADTSCTEIPLTRENNYELTFLGRGQIDGRDRVWLRDKSGVVLNCFVENPDRDEPPKCEPTQLTFGDAPQAADPNEPDQAAITAGLEAALRSNNLVDADRWLGEGMLRFPGNRAWAQYQQRIVQGRTQQAAAQRLQQARQLIVEARKFAGQGDFAAAESMLQEANKFSPNLPEIAQARTDIARLRVERDQRYAQRAQMDTAIRQALGAYRLWEAERLIGDAGRRFPNDAGFNTYRTRLAQMRAEAQWQRRVAQAREFVVGARRSIALGDYGQADRQLDQAEQAAPGLPEIAQARADVSRLRIETELRNDEIRQLTVAINTDIERRRFGSAERLLNEAKRRFPRVPAWADLDRRLDQARGNTRPGNPPGDPRARLAEARELIVAARRFAAAGNFAEAETRLARAQTLAPDLPELRQARVDIDRQMREADARANAGRIQKLVAEARQQIRRNDFNDADRAIDQAEKLNPRAPEVIAVRAELNKARADAQRDEAEIRTRTAAIDTAIDRKQFADADRLLADAQRRYPTHKGWADLQRKLAQAKTANDRDGRNAKALEFVAAARKAASAGNWAQAEQSLKQAETTAPDMAEVKAARVEVTRLKQQDDAKKDADAKAAAERLRTLVAQARDALGKKDYPAAERAIVEAEKLNPNAADVKAVRADYNRARGDAARQETEIKALSTAIGGAIDRKQFDQAERQLADANRRYPNNAAWADLQKRLTDAKAAAPTPPNNADTPVIRAQRFVIQARQAIERKNLQNAERAVVEAEKLAADDAQVKAVRAELEAAKKAAPPPRRP